MSESLQTTVKIHRAPSGGAVIVYSPAVREVKLPKLKGKDHILPPLPPGLATKVNRDNKINRRMKSLEDLLYSLTSTPKIEIFLLFDFNRFDQRNITDANESRRYRESLRKFARNLSRKYPECWFIYRWSIKLTHHGLAMVRLNLLGDTCDCSSTDEINEYVRTSWKKIMRSEYADLAKVRIAHANSLNAFIEPQDKRFNKVFELFLNRTYNFGKIGKDRMHLNEPTTFIIGPEKKAKIARFLIDAHTDYKEQAGKKVNKEYLNMLNAVNGRAVLSEEQYQQLLGIIQS